MIADFLRGRSVYGKQKLLDESALSAYKESRGALPNDITPIAGNTPLRTKREPLRSPRSSGATLAPWVMIATTITSILIKARVDAFAN